MPNNDLPPRNDDDIAENLVNPASVGRGPIYVTIEVVNVEVANPELVFRTRKQFHNRNDAIDFCVELAPSAFGSPIQDMARRAKLIGCDYTKLQGANVFTEMQTEEQLMAAEKARIDAQLPTTQEEEEDDQTDPSGTDPSVSDGPDATDGQGDQDDHNLLPDGEAPVSDDAGQAEIDSLFEGSEED